MLVYPKLESEGSTNRPEAIFSDSPCKNSVVDNYFSLNGHYLAKILGSKGRRPLRANVFTSVFFDFSKKGIFKGYFDLFFDREEHSKNNFLHYKPCPLKSLSNRKS